MKKSLLSIMAVAGLTAFVLVLSLLALTSCSLEKRVSVKFRGCETYPQSVLSDRRFKGLKMPGTEYSDSLILYRSGAR